jgi:hypothetical protein
LLCCRMSLRLRVFDAQINKLAPEIFLGLASLRQPRGRGHLPGTT